MTFALEALARRQSAERLGQLGRFELVDVAVGGDVFASERSRLESSPAVERTVPVYHTSDDEVPFVPEGPIYLSFHDGVSDREQAAVLGRHGLSILRTTPGGALKVARADVSDPVPLVLALQQEQSIVVAEPDFVTYRELLLPMPDDHRFRRQWHLLNQGQIDGVTSGLVEGADVRAVAAWERLGGKGSKAPIVGIIDDGFDLTHPDLVHKAVSPWDFNRGSNDVSPQPHLDDPAGGGDWHGTACAGLAVGWMGGGEIVGVAPNAQLMPVRMDPDLSPSSVARCFDHMTTHGAWVVSCSWKAKAKRYPLPTEVSEAIARCAAEGRGGKGAVIVFAAGNRPEDINAPDGATLNGYAIHPDVLAVAGSTSKDVAWESSAHGREIAVCAPSGGGLGARNIATSDVVGTFTDSNGVERRLGYAMEDYFDQFVGTSAACPLVGAIAALVLDANPALTATEVRDIVRVTARKIGPAEDYQDGHSPRYGHGCANADGAVALALKMKTDAGALVAALRAVPEARRMSS